MLVGTNPRKEAAVLNSRIRRAWLQRRAKIALIGPSADLTYPYEWLGNSLKALDEVAQPGHPFGDAFRSGQRAMVIVGQSALNHPDGEAVLAKAAQLAESAQKDESGWNGFNVLHSSAALVGGLDIGFVPGKGGLDIAGMLDGCYGRRY